MLARPRPRLTYANVMATIALFLALGGGTLAATRFIGSDGQIHGCVGKKGALTALKPGKKCGKGQTAIAWNATAPSGAVSFFNLAGCPSGWSEVTSARGRYLVGLPPGGKLAGTAGTALTNLEDRATGQHTHALSDAGHSHDYTTNWGFVDTASSGTVRRPLFGFRPVDAIGHPDVPAFGPAATGISVNPAGDVPGTNAPYMQLLVCQKT